MSIARKYVDISTGRVLNNREIYQLRLKLLSEGYNYAVIGKIFGVGRSAISNQLKSLGERKNAKDIDVEEVRKELGFKII